MSEKTGENVKVIGVGMPRTGTSSLQAALQILGYDPCHHMVSDVLADVYGRGYPWMDAWGEPDKDKRHARIRDLLKGYQAVVDFPASLMVDDLLEVYPDAKYILTTRSSAEQWRESFSKTLDLTMTPWWYISTIMLPSTRFLVFYCAPKWEAQNRRLHDAVVYRTDSTTIYHRHNEYICKIVPKEQLLEYQAGAGWEPLCKFLGKDVPHDQAYPRLFDAKDNRKWFLIGAAMGCGMWAAAIAATLGFWYLGLPLLEASAR